ncbi:TetR/AcrR family transcriptional regulator [Dyella sp. S184]|uniref:TetR/AcrR family transcriptional regulator n=1 Tax=Dyella sp. S184 TaxID=1641862 RepID=UPI00131B9883|nr:TetR/AcrR family transcriptional regulator [Dyella sp. S184]
MNSTHVSRLAEKPASRGRPRSEATHRAILEAVIVLIAEGESLEKLSIEAVAARAGVGKATIYRRWPNMDALFLETFDSTIVAMPDFRGRSVREDLALLLTTIADPKAGVRQLFHARIYIARLIEGVRNPEFMRRYREVVVEPRRKVLTDLLRRGQTSGELRADLDLEIAHNLLVTPVLHRLLAMRAGDRLPKNFIERLVNTALSGLSPRVVGADHKAPTNVSARQSRPRNKQ